MRHARRQLRYTCFVLAATMAGLVALAGCTMVNDTLTGVSLDRHKTKISSCVKKCAEKNASMIKKENRRHLEAIRKCNRVTKHHGDGAACLAAEDALHQSRLATIQAQHDRCVNHCHQQGGGDQ
jgi:hypothetical protein